MFSKLPTLVLNSWMHPHRITTWQEAICMLVCSKCGTPRCARHSAGIKVDVLEEYEATVSSPSITLCIPAVVRLKREVSPVKKGVKFSRINILTRDGFRCTYCNEKKLPKELTYDHVFPSSRGGKTVWENIISACYKCNRRKGNRTPEEAGMKMHFKPHRPKVLPMTQPFLMNANDLPSIWLPYLEGHGMQAAG